jgi:hypothetical protein
MISVSQGSMKLYNVSMRNQEDPLAPARGMVIGTVLGATTWTLIILLFM